MITYKIELLQFADFFKTCPIEMLLCWNWFFESYEAVLVMFSIKHSCILRGGKHKLCFFTHQFFVGKIIFHHVLIGGLNRRGENNVSRCGIACFSLGLDEKFSI